jgi:hypothetical protein
MTKYIPDLLVLFKLKSLQVRKHKFHQNPLGEQLIHYSTQLTEKRPYVETRWQNVFKHKDSGKRANKQNNCSDLRGWELKTEGQRIFKYSTLIRKIIPG